MPPAEPGPGRRVRLLILAIAAAAVASFVSQFVPREASTLAVENVRFERLQGTSLAVMASGDIVNVGGAPSKPNRLRFDFRDAEGKSIGEWSSDLHGPHIAPKGRHWFMQRLEPPRETAAIHVRCE